MDGEGEVVGLVDIVIRVLVENDNFDFGERCVIGF